MITFYAHHLEELKDCVLIAAAVTNLTPSDCKLISMLISKKTKQNISETTLKRVYGFAYSKFKPSYFTLDVLSKYCGYEGWEDFCETQRHLKANNDTDIDWRLLQQNAAKITGFTLQALKNKSGIPYNQTIKRSFIDSHLTDFENSDHTGTIISAPAGYGKTIAICHWIDDKLNAELVAENNDILLFFSSDALMSILISGRDINSWMLALLGYTVDSDITSIFNEEQRKNGKFYLIIDGLNSHMLKNETTHLIFKQLMDVFSLYQHHSWFKLILVSRNATWINYRHEMETGNNTWFTGFTSQSNFINVPLFNLQELKQLAKKINPNVNDNFPIQVAEIFNNPLYFQLYYKTHKDSFDLTTFNEVDLYEVVSLYAYNKIYLGTYSSDKLLLITGLIDQFDIISNLFKVSRLRANELIKTYNHAYNELLSIGFLKELNESNSYQYSTNIIFANKNLLEHSLATIFLEKCDNQFNVEFIQIINSVFANNAYKISALKWGIFHTIKSEQLRDLEHLTGAQLNANEKLELLKFLAQILEKEIAINNDLINFHLSDKLLDYFLGLELISEEYKKLLLILLKFKLINRQQIVIHTALATVALVRLDMNTLETELSTLRSYPKAEYEKFVLNPLSCLDALYYHLKFGITKKEVLIELTRLQFSINEYQHTLIPNKLNDMLYLLGTFTILLCNNPKKTLRFVKSLKNSYRKCPSEKVNSSYNFFLNTHIANANFELGNIEGVSSIYHSISDTYKKCNDMLTPYMKVIFHNLKIKTLIKTSKEESIFNEIRNIDSINESGNYKLHRLYLSSMLLNHPSLQSVVPALYKQANYDFNKIIREEGLNNGPFMLKCG